MKTYLKRGIARVLAVMMAVSLCSAALTSLGVVKPQTAYAAATGIATATKGQTVNLGPTIAPDGYNSAGAAAQWQVLDVQDAQGQSTTSADDAARLLLIAKDVWYSYDDASGEDLGVAFADIDTWCTNFYADVLNSDDRVATVDGKKVFVLSRTQANDTNLFADDAARKASDEWWLSTNIGTSNAYTVNTNGEIKYKQQTDELAMRPAFYLDLSKVTCSSFYRSWSLYDSHSFGSWTKKDDEKHQRTCSRDQVVEEADHTWDEGVVADGVKTYTCSVCNGTKTEEVPAEKPDLVITADDESVSADGGECSWGVWSLDGDDLVDVIAGSDFAVQMNAGEGWVDRDDVVATFEEGTNDDEGTVTINVPANSDTTAKEWRLVYDGILYVLNDQSNPVESDCPVITQAAYVPPVITFDANGGTVEPASAAVVDGKLESLPTPTHSNENMAFLGWFTEATGGDQVTTATEFAENATIYAHWTDTSAPWSEDDFTYGDVTVKATSDWDATTNKAVETEYTGYGVTGLSDTGKAKIVKNQDLVLPDAYDGKDIVAIGAGTNGKGTFFADADGKTYVPTSVKLPAKLEMIGQFAFSAVTEKDENNKNKQTGLTSVAFPNTLKAIGMSAFMNAPLTEVVIPDSVVALGNGVFTGNDANLVKIESVTLPKNIKVIPQALFNTQAIKGALVIPAGVVAIVNSAFAGCPITSVVIPDGVTYIGNSAFQSTDLAEVEIPGSVKTIGNYAFRFSNTGGTRESLLTSVKLNKGLESIGNGVFTGNKLTVVEIPSTVTTLNKAAFASNTGVDDGKVLLKVATQEQFDGTSTFVSNGTGHKVSVDVTFDANGGEAVDPATVQTGLGLKLESLPLPTNADTSKMFDGWYTEQEGGEKVSADTEYVKNTTLYAHWANTDEVKGAAIAELDKVDLSKYSGDELANVKKAIADAKVAIAAAATVDEVNAAKSQADKTIAAQKTDAQKKAEQEAADKKAAEEKAKTVKTVTVNVKKVNAKAIDAAVKKAGGSEKYVTKIVLGKKVKKISKKSFKKYTKVTVLEVRSKKLTKKSVKGSLKSSKIKTVKVKVAKKAKTNKKYVKKYKKIFTKKNAGKKVKVKR